MKKQVLIYFIIMFSIQLSAQDDYFSPEQNSFTPITFYQTGDVIIDAYFGYTGPGLALRIINLDPGTETHVFGPAGLRIQYMVSEGFGIGVDVNYEKKTGNWDSEYTTTTWNNSNQNYERVTNVYEANYQVTKIKAMVRTSWVFVNKENFSANWANSIGYKAGNRTLDDPHSSSISNDITNTIPLGKVGPIAFRTALGMLFLFTDNIGIHFEAGMFGGGWILGGLSFKL
jgi:hypothetical protein